MGMVDLFKADATVELKVGDLYEFMKVAADNSAKARYLMNAIRCEVPYQYAREIMTGEPETIGAMPQDDTEEKAIDIDATKAHLGGLSTTYKVTKDGIEAEEKPEHCEDCAEDCAFKDACEGQQEAD